MGSRKLSVFVVPRVAAQKPVMRPEHVGPQRMRQSPPSRCLSQAVLQRQLRNRALEVSAADAQDEQETRFRGQRARAAGGLVSRLGPDLTSTNPRKQNRNYDSQVLERAPGTLTQASSAMTKSWRQSDSESHERWHGLGRSTVGPPDLVMVSLAETLVFEFAVV